MTQNKGAIPGSHASHEAATHLRPSGFDPKRMAALADYMRRAARSASEASRIMAQAKSLRQAHNPPRDDLYCWAEPERTVEWEIADILDAIAMEAAEPLRP